MDTLNLTELRFDLASRMKWNLAFWITGCIFWIYAAAVGALLPLEQAKWFWFIGSFNIVAVAKLVSFIVRADIAPKGNKLALLMGNAHVSVIFLTYPMVIAALYFYPPVQILVMAICFGLDFYVMTWAYGTRIPVLHAVIRTAAASAIWFALPRWRMVGIPLFVATAYFVTILLMERERRKWLAEHQR